jgi:hypothetical protein
MQSRKFLYHSVMIMKTHASSSGVRGTFGTTLISSGVSWGGAYTPVKTSSPLGARLMIPAASTLAILRRWFSSLSLGREDETHALSSSLSTIRLTVTTSLTSAWAGAYTPQKTNSPDAFREMIPSRSAFRVLRTQISSLSLVRYVGLTLLPLEIGHSSRPSQYQGRRSFQVHHQEGRFHR